MPTTADGGGDGSTSGASEDDGATSMATADSQNGTSMGDGGSSDPVADGTTTGAEDGSSDGIGGTGGPGPHDGVYSGTISATFTVGGVGSYECSGQAVITVDSTAPQVVNGTASCQVYIQQLGGNLTVNGSITGDVNSPAASGTLTITEMSGLLNNSGPWVGDFNGDVLDGNFNGTVPWGSGVPYTGSWNTLR